jgi:hypothetical protein
VAFDFENIARDAGVERNTLKIDGAVIGRAAQVNASVNRKFKTLEVSAWGSVSADAHRKPGLSAGFQLRKTW